MTRTRVAVSSLSTKSRIAACGCHEPSTPTASAAVATGPSVALVRRQLAGTLEFDDNRPGTRTTLSAPIENVRSTIVKPPPIADHDERRLTSATLSL